MVTGNMGSKLNMNYTMMGEEVNLASRLESGAKFYGIKFYTTYETLKKAGLNNYYWRYIDRVTFQKQIWQFNEISSLIKTFYSNYIMRKYLNNSNIDKIEIRFTKVLTKYSTEYNNSIFINNLCQELNLDNKDMLGYFCYLKKNEEMNKIENIL